MNSIIKKIIGNNNIIIRNYSKAHIIWLNIKFQLNNRSKHNNTPKYTQKNCTTHALYP